jgi:hypothetical protein
MAGRLTLQVQNLTRQAHAFADCVYVAPAAFATLLGVEHAGEEDESHGGVLCHVKRSSTEMVLLVRCVKQVCCVVSPHTPELLSPCVCNANADLTQTPV